MSPAGPSWGRRSRLTGAEPVVAVALLVGCGAPPAPSFEAWTPPAPAATTCRPPFERFGPGSVRITDRDRGRACVALLERDECVVGIFDDCTEEGPARREWQGRISGDRVELTPYLVGGSPGPRLPLACTGTLTVDGRLEAACRLKEDVAPPHQGLSLELLD